MDRAKRFVWARRALQGSCLILFFVLILSTRGSVEDPPSRWLQIFFDIDPLILVSTWFATHTLAGLSLLALITIAVTFILGRVFCGWICPFGTLHNMMTWLRRRRREGRPRIDLFSRWQRAKFYLLFVLIVMALLGVHWIGVFDPASMLYRSAATAFLPATQQMIEQGATDAYQSDPHVGPLHVTTVTEPVYRFFRDQIFVAGRPVFFGSALILFLFFAALLANLYRPRFWCRYVCPLGALLGLCAKRTALRLAPTEQECTHCNLCAIACPAAAQPERRGEWLPSECFGCWNCVAACNRQGIDFRFDWPWRRPESSSVNLMRRSTVSAVLAGIGGLLLFRVTPQAQGKTYNPTLIRPPGARPEPEFLQRCVQCGLCMKVCPPNAIHPTWMEAGLEGVWTPVMNFRIGYCDYECNLCGQVCPTEAIEPLELPTKKKVVIGLASFDTTRCLPYAFGRECIVCEEHCPIPTKAIYFVMEEVTLRNGATKLLKRPRIDTDLCTGCGICEAKCVFKDLPAIRVTSGGEDRHPKNQPILPGAAATVDDPYGG